MEQEAADYSETLVSMGQTNRYYAYEDIEQKANFHCLIFFLSIKCS
jgi:hypothetical protein